ncbi:MAG: prepilin-type N-terminal cleavage/methylation domain-containing protein [Verrucomicrobiota bacterium]
MKNRPQQRAFTSVEIMIVVVIIGLLATFAIPTFKKIRSQSTFSMMRNDARQLGAGAQQYFLETGAIAISFTTSADGSLGSPMDEYVTKISQNYASVSETITEDGIFFLSHSGYNNGDPVYFTNEGALASVEP